MTDLATKAPENGNGELLEEVLVGGNLAKLTPHQRATYYLRVCESLGLNALTRPFEYLLLNGRLILYARKDATDQLRHQRRVSLTIAAREVVNDLYVVTARAVLPDGRTDEEIGAVPIGGLKGEALANAMMKASTKAKRRATLSICGLGALDESEVESIPGARRLDDDGVIHEEVPALSARSEAMTAAWDQEMAAADALAAEPLPVAVPADDVDGLVGEELAEACNRMRRALVAADVPHPAIPRGGVEKNLRVWWHHAATMLAARQPVR